MKKLLFVLFAVLAAPVAAQEFEAGAGADSDGDVVASLRVAGLDLPGFEAAAYVEADYADGFQYRVWSSNLVRRGDFVVGVEVLVFDSGDFDFNQRAVAGYQFSERFAARARFLEDLEFSNLQLQLTYSF